MGISYQRSSHHHFHLQVVKMLSDSRNNDGVDDSNKPTPASVDPLCSTPKRKLLGVRVFLVCFAALAPSVFIADWFEKSKLDISWLQYVFGTVAFFQFCIFIAVLFKCAVDLVIHFVPKGRTRNFLLSGKQSPEFLAAEFNELGPSFCKMTLAIPLILAGITIFVVLAFGGIAVIGALFSAVFASWPIWAIVLAILLIAVLLKK
jgi:hypothetical protein